MANPTGENSKLTNDCQDEETAVGEGGYVYGRPTTTPVDYLRDTRWRAEEWVDCVEMGSAGCCNCRRVQYCSRGVVEVSGRVEDGDRRMSV